MQGANSEWQCTESFHEAKYLCHKAHMVEHAKLSHVVSASPIFLLGQRALVDPGVLLLIYSHHGFGIVIKNKMETLFKI